MPNLKNINKRHLHRALNNIGFVAMFFAYATVFIGCGYKEQELKPVEIYTVKYIDPPKIFTDKILIPEPMPVDKYLSLNIKDREKELASYIVKLISIAKTENMKKDELLKYIEDIKKAEDEEK